MSEQGRAKIVAATEIYVSSASIWEASIKIAIGKLEADVNDLVLEIEKNHFQELPIIARHAASAMQLPDIHRDPFDQMLIAQSLCKPLRFLTADSLLKGYSELVNVI